MQRLLKFAWRYTKLQYNAVLSHVFVFRVNVITLSRLRTRVCVSVCLSVCPLAYLRNHTNELH